MKRLIAILLFAASAAAEPPLWSPTTHIQKSIPTEWVPPGTAKTALTEEIILSRERFPFDVVEFVKEYGAPNRYLVSKKQQVGYTDVLVYDLPKHTVALFVPTPPERRMGAIVVMDENGRDVRLIK